MKKTKLGIISFFTKWGLAQRYIILQICKKDKKTKSTSGTAIHTFSCDPTDLVVGQG